MADRHRRSSRLNLILDSLPRQPSCLRIGRDLYTPVGMKWWYHALFRRESDGAERLLTIDQILKKMSDWTG